jgi:cell division GTPase FtsZ
MRENGKAMMGRRGFRGKARAHRGGGRNFEPADRGRRDQPRALLVSVSDGKEMTCSRSTKLPTAFANKQNPTLNIIVGATFDESLEGGVRVSVVATGPRQCGGSSPGRQRVETVVTEITGRQRKGRASNRCQIALLLYCNNRSDFHRFGAADIKK